VACRPIEIAVEVGVGGPTSENSRHGMMTIIGSSLVDWRIARAVTRGSTQWIPLVRRKMPRAALGHPAAARNGVHPGAGGVDHDARPPSRAVSPSADRAPSRRRRRRRRRV